MVSPIFLIASPMDVVPLESPARRPAIINPPRARNTFEGDSIPRMDLNISMSFEARAEIASTTIPIPSITPPAKPEAISVPNVFASEDLSDLKASEIPLTTVLPAVDAKFASAAIIFSIPALGINADTVQKTADNLEKSMSLNILITDSARVLTTPHNLLAKFKRPLISPATISSPICINSKEGL